MNVIEALFITLGLDTSDYEKKQKGVLTSLTKMGETSDKQTKLIAESGKKAAQTFSLLKVEVLGALAAFGMSTGFKSFIESNMNGQAALGRMSANLGMSTQKLQAWKLAAKEMGQSGEDATSALQSVAKGVAEARITGTSSLIQASRRFGFGVDTNNPEQTLINISRRMAQMHDRQQAMQIAEAAGVGNISNLLLLGPDALEQRLAHTMALTGAATKASTEQAAKLQMQWADLQERFRQVGERAFNKLEPILARLGERFANWLDSINWQDVINKISHFIDKVQEVVKELGGWKTIAEVLGGVLALKLLTPLVGIVGALGQMGPAVAIAAAAFAGWKLGEWIANNMSPEMREKVGRFTATLLALGGNKEAQDAIAMEEKVKALDAARNDPNVSAAVRKAAAGKMNLRDPAVIKMLSDHVAAQAKAAGVHLGGPEIGSDFLGKYDPQHSRQFGGNNAGMFAILEKEYGLPAGMLARKFQVESANGIQLVSAAGALGPMQFMPETAKALGLTIGRNGNVMDLDASAKAAAQYLQQLHNQFGDWDKANAAYNWGPGNLKKDVAAHGAQWLNFAPSETQKYVAMHRLLQSASPSSSFAKRQGPTTNTSTVSIGTLNVNTKATDANGVAKGMKTAMQSNPLIAGSVTSLA